MHDSKPVLIIFLVLIWCGCVLSEIYFTQRAPHVQLPNKAIFSGSVKFSRDGRPFNAFVGIPYAVVPERFQPAQLLKGPWKGTKEATTRGNICPQFPFGKDEGLMGHEDCLNLNVYVPMGAKVKTKLPVMVWIHGGGFLFGDGVQYGPKFFMDEDVILVTLNYRLGVFGFLSTGDDVVPGNNGLKDVVIALKWVQENIGTFGGDADKVTIFGESAGGAAVHYLILSPSAKGLFHRAIAQSGSALDFWAYNPTPRENAVKLATYLKCPTEAATPEDFTSQEILECLKGLSTEELSKAQLKFKHSWPANTLSLFFVPTAEPENSANSFITKPPQEIVLSQKGAQNEVPFITGVTKDEGAYLLAGAVLHSEELTRELDTNWDAIVPMAFSSMQNNHVSAKNKPAVIKKLREFYFGDKPVSKETRQNLSNLYSDDLIVYGVYRMAKETASRWTKHPVYLYQYAYPGPLSLMGMAMGIPVDYDETTISHGDEILHQFNLVEEDDGNMANPGDKKFSKEFVSLWATFAAKGKPEFIGSAKWKPLSIKQNVGITNLKWYKIGRETEVIEDPYKERMAFWDELLKNYFNPSLKQRDEL